MRDKSFYSNLIKQRALDHGFQYCGISKAEFLEEEARPLENWLEKGFQGKMGYMNNYFDLRLDPRKLVPGAKSVISLMYNYYPKESLSPSDEYQIARYAYGEDYHTVIKEKLSSFSRDLQSAIGDFSGRVFVDSAPVMERVWGRKSGLGWIGKNSLLLNREWGSYFFLAELILDVELAYDGPVKDYCGSCMACMDACPTEAIPAPYQVDASKCISYFTIELKEDIPADVNGKLGNWIFGCDICQEVCPWNRFSKPHSEARFDPSDEMKGMNKAAWKELTEEVFESIFKKSPLKRTGFKGMKRNIAFVSPEENPDATNTLL